MIHILYTKCTNGSKNDLVYVVITCILVVYTMDVLVLPKSFEEGPWIRALCTAIVVQVNASSHAGPQSISLSPRNSITFNCY